MKKILCAVDLGQSDKSADVLKQANALAQLQGSKLSVITVVPDFGMSIVGSFFDKGSLDKALAKANADLHSFVSETLPEAKVQHIVALGTVYEEVLEAAKKLKVDLVVIGANKPDLKDKMLGPNAARVARHAKASVYIVR
ncbi:universal stress protein [Amylibacter kogurei]|uniref:Universal stress protein n=1 Tax=Paramylibacter kogurei TaxID=1889778 RepID=A0A2G5KBC4_9RHOB|nr:universal stress protein [Amylibacter kogurei]PIB26816.1 universal stress protein [Amylibacter kogurei]